MKQYDPKEQSHEDLTTFWGRVKYFQNIIAPSNCMKSSETLLSYSQIIDNIAKDPSLAKQYKNEEVWRMRYIVDSNIHQQTKQIILWPFRTSSFVPVNIPLGYALGVLPPTPLNQIVAQSANQMYNFMFNYENRNASNVFTNQALALSFVGAISSAVIGSVGTSYVFKKLNAPSLLIRACPLLGIWIANSFNLFFARYQDFQKGIEVFDDETGDKLPGVSKQAASIAFYKCLATRFILPTPMFIPPIVIYYMKQAKVYPAGKAAGLAVDLTLAGLFLYGGLSIGVALAPQHLKVSPSQLEQHFQNIKNSKGNQVHTIVFNKGI